MEEKVLRVIKKVRDGLCFQEKYGKILSHSPQATFDIEGDRFILWSIKFSDGYESISINNKHIIYTPSNGQYEILVHFENLDELLEM